MMHYEPMKTRYAALESTLACAAVYKAHAIGVALILAIAVAGWGPQTDDDAKLREAQVERTHLAHAAIDAPVDDVVPPTF